MSGRETCENVDRLELTKKCRVVNATLDLDGQNTEGTMQYQKVYFASRYEATVYFFRRR